MRISEENIDLYEAYLGHSMTEKQILEFEARLAYDKEFSNEFEAFQQLEIGIQKHFRNKLKSKFSEIDDELEKKSIQKNQWRKVVVWSSSIAALLLIGIFICRSFISDESQLVAQYWPYEEGLPVKMSAKDKYDDAMNAFKLGEWEKSEQLLKNIKTDTANYFIGVIAYEQKEYEKSSKYLMKIENTSLYYQEAQFRLALIAIINKNDDLARKILQTQVNQHTAFMTLSKEILEKLK